MLCRIQALGQRIKMVRQQFNIFMELYYICPKFTYIRILIGKLLIHSLPFPAQVQLDRTTKVEEGHH